MRVLLDVNILASFLLSPASDSPIHALLRAGFMGAYTLVLPQEVLEELVRTIKARPHLQARITAAQAEELVDLLGQIAQSIPTIPEAIPRVTRDPKDDYLLAYALIGDVDYLVTGDHDLLALGQVERVKIISPREFWEIIAGQ